MKQCGRVLGVLVGLFIVSVFVFAQNQASASPTSSKSSWLEDAFITLQAHPEIKAVSYWHEKWQQYGLDADLRIDSTPKSRKIYSNSVSDKSFVSTITTNDLGKIVAPKSGVYHGAYPGFVEGSSEIVTKEKIERFEEIIGKPLAWVYFSDDWSDGVDFPKQAVEAIVSSGSIPFIRLMAWSSYQIEGKDPRFNLQAFIDGEHDAEIRKWARGAKEADTPIMVEYGTEVNGEWFPWNGRWNGRGKTNGFGDPDIADGPERFVAAYRHLINLCRDEGADNITWAYHVNMVSVPDKTWNSMKAYYPGDEYIDWIGVSIYGPVNKKDPDKYSFKEIYEYIEEEFRSISLNKPLAIFEFGVGEL